ncbi:MAG: putative lipid II flippase FtsW [Endomicrobiales bacterium]|nr:putative lipid II flippase FtsW [Endomicrobiales bacterium]
MARGAPSDSFDYVLLFVTAILTVIGTVMVFSSSVIMADVRWQAPYLFVTKHVIWVLVGAAALFFFSNFKYYRLQDFAKPAVFAIVILLILVLFVGSAKGGARRWFSLGPLSFQPSELAKLVLIIALADYLDRKKSKLKNWAGIAPPLILVGLFSFLVAMEPDLGTPLIMVIVGILLLFVGGTSVKYILALGAAVLPLVAFEIIRKPYRIQRIRDFLGSWGDINSGSYQLNQSLLALGSGGFFGKGLAQSQMKLLYLPEPHTDFIFPIIGEELGFAGTVFVILLFVFFAWRGWNISRKSADYFGSLLALGITLMISVQAVMNMAVSCGLVPTKGLPLPFVSFGGTALVLNLASVGILLNISKRPRNASRK